MSNSKEGHRRYWTRRELGKLTEKYIYVCNSNEEVYYDDFSNGGVLKRVTTAEKNNENGFYFNGHKIPVRSVNQILEGLLITNKDYLNERKGVAA